MAIAYRSSTTASTGAGTATTLVVNTPAGIADLDVLVWTVYNRQASATEIAAPSGWTTILTVTVGSPVSFLTAFYRVVTSAAGEPANYTATMSPAANCAGGISAYSGVDNATPIDVTAVGQTNASSASVASPAITPVSADVMLIFAGFVAGSTSPTWTPPGTMTERYESVNTAANITAITNDDEPYNNAGVSTGTRTATSSVAAVNGAMLVALRPGGAGGGGGVATVRYVPLVATVRT